MLNRYADSLWEIEIINDEGRLDGRPFLKLDTPSLRATPLEEGNIPLHE